ncbi:MAG: hypothetical protein FWE54_02445, partial [Methanimicrococcus sp.]|nr:hypothetical protein [Methanimicrococcus sp.]
AARCSLLAARCSLLAARCEQTVGTYIIHKPFPPKPKNKSINNKTHKVVDEYNSIQPGLLISIIIYDSHNLSKIIK